MPKIPTFTAQARPTAQAASVVSNIKVNVNQSVAAALRPLGKAAEDYYVKEKKLEADNKATLALSDLYVNQNDGTKGLYTLQSETEANGNPGDASIFFDDGVNKLWSYAQSNKIGDLDNFTKKALEKKFYATAGIFKTKALSGSRKYSISRN